MYNYLDLLRYILDYGEPHNDRTGVGTQSVFGASLMYDLNGGLSFPIMTTKRMPFRTIFYELMWFLSGSSDIRDLWAHNVHIWDQNYLSDSWQKSEFYRANKPFGENEFSVGRNYGAQWREFTAFSPGDDEGLLVDQMQTLLTGLTKDPYSRRHVVSAWNPCETSRTALPPCHILFQLKVHQDESLSLIMYQRSADGFLGVPFNITSYALLLMMLAHVTGRKAHKLRIFFGDIHIYNTHKTAVVEQLERDPYPLPSLEIMKTQTETPTVDDLLSFTLNDFRLHNYDYHPSITAPMAV